jgi:hypothetical protein
VTSFPLRVSLDVWASCLRGDVGFLKLTNSTKSANCPEALTHDETSHPLYFCCASHGELQNLSEWRNSDLFGSRTVAAFAPTSIHSKAMGCLKILEYDIFSSLTINCQSFHVTILQIEPKSRETQHHEGSCNPVVNPFLGGGFRAPSPGGATTTCHHNSIVC